MKYLTVGGRPIRNCLKATKIQTQILKYVFNDFIMPCVKPLCPPYLKFVEYYYFFYTKVKERVNTKLVPSLTREVTIGIQNLSLSENLIGINLVVKDLCNW